MYYPEHLLFRFRSLFVYFYDDCDRRRKLIPWYFWVNPLRYEISWALFNKRIVINRAGHWNLLASNIWWKRKPIICKLRGHKPASYKTHCERCGIKIVKDRYVQILVDGTWLTKSFDALRKGDKFKLYEPDGTRESMKIYTALSNAIAGHVEVDMEDDNAL